MRSLCKSKFQFVFLFYVRILAEIGPKLGFFMKNALETIRVRE